MSRASRSTRPGRGAPGPSIAAARASCGSTAPVEGLPGGVVSALAFAPGGALTITAGPPEDSTDVWTAAPEVVRRTRSAVGGLDRAGFVRPELDEVESFDGRRIPYLRFGPAGRPALCWVHGGPESQFRPQMAPVIQYLCAQGITVAAPNVRGSTGYGRTYHHLDDVELRLDSVSDLAALARALGAGAGTPVGVMGGSYGGYMTMAAITEHPELWSCAVNIVGIVNFVTFLERTGAYRRALREAEYGSLAHDRDFLESISPIRKIDRIACPLMVIHGANDPRVPVSEAEQVVAAPARARRARRVPPLRGRGPRHHAPRQPPRLLPARGGVPAAHLLHVTCNAARMHFEADLEAARARIGDGVVRTPVWRSDELDAALGCQVWLKCEPLQRTGSFKLRGATNAVRALPAGTRGVVAVSSGNHAQAVAYAGRAAGLPVTVVMNADANGAKVAATIAYGATIVSDGVDPRIARRSRAPSPSARASRSCTRSTTGT